MNHIRGVGVLTAVLWGVELGHAYNTLPMWKKDRSKTLADW